MAEAVLPLGMIQAWKKKAIDYYALHEKQIEILFFVGGFIFDVLFLSEIDDYFSIAQQAVYLLIIVSIIHYEILFRLHKWKPQNNFLTNIWQYRELILHFLLGSLLSVYSLFYIKSASFISSLVFLAAMVILLISNELPIVKKAKVSFKMGLYAICLFSFISILFPLVLGFVGWTPFGLALATTLGFFYLQIRFLKKFLDDEKTLRQTIFFPGISVLLIFCVFYFAGWIPPVPLSAKEQGIYHLVEKQNGKYLLSTEKSWWNWIRLGDQVFNARPGDKIYFYLQIYSPARFADQIYVRWLFKDPVSGWQKTDRIPLSITGGRENGFRALTTKANYQPGQWRVQVETSMGHEISRTNFQVVEDPSQEPRDFQLLER
jgi:hypothetical protein